MHGQDPFLFNHTCRPRILTAGGRLTPISIRDQIIRGRMLVDRAVERKWIGKNDEYPFLVVGAGVSGITAASRAAYHGVRTIVIDREDHPFSVQRACASRWICPTQYDWPVDHYLEGKYPFDPELWGEPLSWSAGRADLLTADWEVQLHCTQKRYPGRIDFFWNTLLTSPLPSLDPSGEFVSAKILKAFQRSDGTPYFDPVAPTHEFRARAVLLAFGFGEEASTIAKEHAARGYRFWETDPVGLPNLRVPNGHPHVLISGSGDGALQDFLRTVIRTPDDGKFYARELYQHLKIAPETEHEIQSLQDHANRSYAWGTGRIHDHKTLSQLHKSHCRLVEDLLRRDPAIRDRVALCLRDPLPEVRLVFECDHFSNCYGLNRFLTLIVSRVLESDAKRKVLVPESRVMDLVPQSPHVCKMMSYNEDDPSDPDACHGWWHAVYLRQSPDCHKETIAPIDGSGRSFFWNANVLILRHGVRPSTFEQSLSTPCSRQILPYSV